MFVCKKSMIMSEKTINILFQILTTLLLFSLWAGFALLVVNSYFYRDLPGYTIGRFCIWELVAIIIAGGLSRLMYLKWDGLMMQKAEKRQYIQLNVKYIYLLLIYFLIATIVGLWQFYLFSQNF